ncbi:MAG: hypothetical protein QM764_22200 [Chitinophagaceae bacterium]
MKPPHCWGGSFYHTQKQKRSVKKGGPALASPVPGDSEESFSYTASFITSQRLGPPGNGRVKLKGIAAGIDRIVK